MITSLKIHSEANKYGTTVEIDGEVYNDVTYIKYEARAGEIPTLTLERIANPSAEVQIEGEAKTRQKNLDPFADLREDYTY